MCEHAICKHIVMMIEGNLQNLCDLLAVTPMQADCFLGGHPAQERSRVYGGQFLGQGIIAACWRQPRGVRSLHASFLRPGTQDAPIEYTVQAMSGTASKLDTRSVSARQNDKVLFAMDIVLGELVAADPVPAGDLPGPEQAIPRQEGIRHLNTDTQSTWANTTSPFDNRFVEDVWHDDYRDPRHHVWFRGRSADPAHSLSEVTAQQMRQAVLAYYVDDTIMDNALFPEGWLTSSAETASLDHCMWFHHDFTYDEWLLHDQDSPVAANGRGLTRGRIFNRAGQPVATTYQEILMRRPTG